MLRAIPVSHVPGVGLSTQKRLHELGIISVYDLLHYFPFRFEDRRIQPFESYSNGDRVTVRAVVDGPANVRWQGRRSYCTAPIRVGGRIRLTGIWFNQHYLKPKLTPGRPLVITGKYDAVRGTVVASLTEFDAVSRGEADRRAWTPIYRVTQGVTSAHLHAIVLKGLAQYSTDVFDVLPHDLRDKYRLISHLEAIRTMHEAESEEAMRQAHRRLAFEEFFLFQLQLQWFRRQRTGEVTRPAHNIPSDALARFTASLPGPLTDAQRMACDDIVSRLRQPQPMNLLLQGDVGSGKTWVALFAAWAMTEVGAQTALMAPTEILAEQHYRQAHARLADPFGVRMALLTGSTSDKNRQALLANLQAGDIDLVIGTHALLTTDVEFSKLGLVITDEQHRFGVSQRSTLRLKGTQPDVLFLSATPIPRTLALAVYGDLDVAVLNQLPAGRKPILTQWSRFRDEQEAILSVRRELAKGMQAYVVSPLVEESEQMADVASATQLASRFSDLFAGHTVGLLHGRLNNKDKEDVMRRFVRGEIDVLVSTTVIEVGIDVPRATVMLIYHAERFGLAQLHQLRGRVGRGGHQSYCILLSDADSDVARRRLETMVETNDGFVIAERDLELRGPGEFLGVRQSGLPEFTVGDLSRDFRIMQVARDEAISLVGKSDFWLLPAYQSLREAIQAVPSQSYFKD